MLFKKVLQNIWKSSYICLFLWGCAPQLPKTYSGKLTMPDSFVNAKPAFGKVSKNDSSGSNWGVSFFEDTLLIQLVDSVVNRNLDIAIASQKIKSSSSDVVLTRGLLRPRVDVTLGSALRRYGLFTMDGAGNSSTYILPGKIVPENLPDYLVGFQSSWEVDVWGKLNDRKKSALHRYISSEEARNWLITQLVKKSTHHYYELQACDLELRCIEESILLQNRAFEIVKAKKEAAILNELAVKQFEAQLLELTSLKKEVENRIIENEKELNDLLGQFYKPIKRDSNFYNQNFVPQTHWLVPGNLLANRSDIQQAYWNLESSMNELSASRKSFYPGLLITSSLGFQGFRPDLLFLTPQSLAYTLVGNMFMPLINRSALKSQFIFNSANYHEAYFQYYKTVIQAYNEVESEWKKWENYSEIFLMKQQETNRLLEAVQIAEDLFRNGRATYLEVLFAQQQALKSKVELVKCRQMQLYTFTNLYSAFGGGWR